MKPQKLWKAKIILRKKNKTDTFWFQITLQMYSYKKQYVHIKKQTIDPWNKIESPVTNLYIC